jgi:hypothetical protein
LDLSARVALTNTIDFRICARLRPVTHRGGGPGSGGSSSGLSTDGYGAPEIDRTRELGRLPRASSDDAHDRE